MRTHKFELTVILLAFMGVGLGSIFTGCSSNDPVSPGESETSAAVQIRVDIQPPSAYRTTDTWNYWTTPVSVYFELEPEAEASEDDHEDDGHAHSLGTEIPIVSLKKVSGGTGVAGTSAAYSGSVIRRGMEIQMEITDGIDLYEMQHGGSMHEHHADTSAQMMRVLVMDAATGHHAHGGLTVPYCGLILTAKSPSDTVELHLQPIQGGHGYRYEANGALPEGTYDIHIEIEPPSFMRTTESKDQWTEHQEVEFSGFQYTNAYSGGTVGETVLVSSGSDSLKVTLRAGSVKTYGAVGMGALPQDGNENINFSVRLEDPTAHPPGQILFDAGVNVTVEQAESDATISGTLNSVFDGHEFYFGENMMIGMPHGWSGSDDDGHDH